MPPASIHTESALPASFLQGPGSRRRGALAVGVAAAILIGFRLGAHALLDPDEAKHALIAREMLEAGRWLEPTVNGAPYHDKPSALYVLMGLAYRLFGAGEWAVRLVPAAATWTTLLASYAYASRESARCGAAAAGLLASSLFFVQLGRFANFDALFVCLLTVALFSLLSSGLAATRFAPGYAGFAAAGAAVLVKGPAAVVLLGPVVVAAVVARGSDLKRLAKGGALALAIVTLWAVPVWLLHPDYLGDFIWIHNLRRYFVEVEIFHRESALFFVPVVFGALLPWSTTLPWIARRAWYAGLSDRLLLGYAAWVVVFFSFSTGKLATYVVPAFPALAVLGARWVCSREAERDIGALGAVALSAAISAIALPAGLAAAYAAAPELVPAAWCLLPISLAGILAIGSRKRSGSTVAALRLVCAGHLAAGLCLSSFAGMPVAAFTSDKDLADALRRERPGAEVVVYRVRPFSFLFYSRLRAPYKVGDARYRELFAAPGPVLVLTKEKRLAPLAALSGGREHRTLARNGRHLLLELQPQRFDATH